MTSACSTTPDTVDDSSSINPQDLLVVDCLLPPQVRQLGERLTYLAQRRAIRTSGAQCALRGGEYVAYDQADFKSALAVWLPLAEKDDPEAQTYVGEIYEKGLGTRQSYEIAASWYQRAANQNYSRAQINLGYLYESGLGVERNLAAALNLYRQASGFTAAELEFVSSIEVAQREAENRQRQELKTDVKNLQSEIAAGRRLLEKQNAQLLQSQRNVQELRESLTKSLSHKSDPTESHTAISSQTEDHNRRLDELQTQLVNTVNQKQALQNQLTSISEHTATLQTQLSASRESLDRSKQELEANNQTIKALESQHETRDEQSTAADNALNEAKQLSVRLARRIRILEQENRRQLEQHIEQTQEDRLSRSTLMNLIAQQKDTIARIERQAIIEREKYLRHLAEIETRREQAERKKQHQTKQYTAQYASDEQKIKKLKKAISDNEADLVRQAAAITSLQSRLATKQAALQPTPVERTVETKPSGPTINIIDPPVLITRGSPALATNGSYSADLIGKIQPADSLFAFRINGLDHPVNNSGLFRFNTSSISGENLELFAVDNQGESTRLALSISQATASDVKAPTTQQLHSFDSDRARLSLENVELGNYHALIIGNDTYPSLNNLNTATNDAIAVEQILRDKYGFRTVLLLDANQKTILSAMERMRATLGQDDNLVIYYAGHGELDKESGRGYWLPVDSTAENKKRWIANSAVTAMIDTMSAKHVLVIADSCYSGYLTRSSIARPLSGVSAELRLKWLKAVSQSRVRTVLSSGGTRPVLDGSAGSSHSIFAKSFLEALERNTEVLETYELFFELQGKVTETAAQLNVEQIPQYAPIRHAGHQAGEFIFVPVSQTTVGASIRRIEDTGQ